MELLVSAKLAHPKFHGIPWNCSCHRNWRTPCSMEFHGIPWNCSCQRNWRILSSMEFHGIPWNCSCQRNWCNKRSMEFHGIPWNFSCQRNWHTSSSMEFHGTARVSEICALQVPWNSMELLVSVPWNYRNLFCCLLEPLVSSMHWVLKWYKIPWNLSFKILMKIVFNCAGWINFHLIFSTKLINTL